MVLMSLLLDHGMNISCWVNISNFIIMFINSAQCLWVLFRMSAAFVNVHCDECPYIPCECCPVERDAFELTMTPGWRRPWPLPATVDVSSSTVQWPWADAVTLTIDGWPWPLVALLAVTSTAVCVRVRLRLDTGCVSFLQMTDGLFLLRNTQTGNIHD